MSIHRVAGVIIWASCCLFSSSLYAHSPDNQEHTHCPIYGEITYLSQLSEDNCAITVFSEKDEERLYVKIATVTEVSECRTIRNHLVEKFIEQFECTPLNPPHEGTTFSESD